MCGRHEPLWANQRGTTHRAVGASEWVQDLQGRLPGPQVLVSIATSYDVGNTMPRHGGLRKVIESEC